MYLRYHYYFVIMIRLRSGCMYSSEKHVCGALYSELICTPGKLKNMPHHSGNRTYDPWTSV